MPDVEAQRLITEIQTITDCSLSKIASSIGMTSPAIYKIADGTTRRVEEMTLIKLRAHLRALQRQQAKQRQRKASEANANE